MITRRLKPHYAAAIVLVLVASMAVAAGPKKKGRKAASQPSAAAASAPAAAARELTIRGVVFEDLNGDGHQDPGEPALADMSVSNGAEWVRTKADGVYELKLNDQISGSAFVCTPAGWRASQRFYIIADYEKYTDQVQPGDLGLQRDDARKADAFTFVQLTDTHVTDAESAVQTMIDDLGVVNRISDAPLFVAATGDLTNQGTRPEQMQAYVRAVSSCRIPYYNVIGNHDYGGKLRPTSNYESYLGPRYYSFDVGRYHFIAKDIVASDRDSQAYPREVQWIEQDLKLNAGDRRIIVLQHYLPTNEEMDWWSRYKTAAIFSGHWHGRRERLYKGILDVNSAPLRFGGIDRSPRGFRIIRINGEKLTCEWRTGQQERRIEIIHPGTGVTVGGGALHVQALAYDTAVRVNSVHYRLELPSPAGHEAAAITEGDLKPSGRWMWTTDFLPEMKSSDGTGRLVVEARAADGSRWGTESSFNLSNRPVVPPQAGEAWRFFHGDEGHRGYVPRGPQPPLTMAWASNVGGTILLASPVIADGKVYVGTGFSESLDDCAVHALDLGSGKRLWRAPVDSSIPHSLAVWGDNVLTVSEAGSLYCFSTEGELRWESSLAREESLRWDLSFPVTDGRTVYAGRGNGFGAYRLDTGQPAWRCAGHLQTSWSISRRAGNRSDWWPSIYSGPSIGTGTIYQGGSFVRALEPATGDVIWSKLDTVVSTVAVVPAVVERGEEGDRLYVFQNNKTLLCLDGKTGAVIWRANRGEAQTATSRPATSQAATSQPVADVPMGDETGTPAVGDKVVCLGSGQLDRSGGPGGSAAMWGFDKQTGRLLWSCPVGTGIVSSGPYKRVESTITSSPVIVGNVVYFGASDGFLYALDVNDGRVLSQYRLGVPIASTVAVSGDAIVVAAWDGTVYAFTSDSMSGTRH